MKKELTQEQIITLAVKAGVEAALDRLKFEKVKEAKALKDKRLHNITLLLKNYRNFKIHAERSVYRAEQIDDEPVDVMSLMSDEAFRRGEDYVESIKSSAVRTALIVKHITEMVWLYEVCCERSSKPEDKRRYRVLYETYISDTEEPLTAEEIAKAENIDVRTIYRDLSAASERLAALIFGVDSL